MWSLVTCQNVLFKGHERFWKEQSSRRFWQKMLAYYFGRTPISWHPKLPINLFYCRFYSLTEAQQFSSNISHWAIQGLSLTGQMWYVRNEMLTSIWNCDMRSGKMIIMFPARNAGVNDLELLRRFKLSMKHYERGAWTIIMFYWGLNRRMLLLKSKMEKSFTKPFEMLQVENLSWLWYFHTQLHELTSTQNISIVWEMILHA